MYQTMEDDLEDILQDEDLNHQDTRNKESNKETDVKVTDRDNKSSYKMSNNYLTGTWISNIKVPAP